MTRIEVAKKLLANMEYTYSSLTIKVNELKREESELNTLHDASCIIAEQSMESIAIYRMLTEVRSELAHAQELLGNLPYNRDAITSNVNTIDELLREVQNLNNEEVR